MKTSEQGEGSPSTIGRPSFVGRATEIALLDHWLGEADGGRGRVTMVAGEPGIGKTRLVEEFAEGARRRGGIVLGGACWEGEGGRAYGPFAEALDGYAGGVEESALRAEMGPYAGVLARLAPRLRARLPDIEEPVALQPDEERIRLFDAVSQFLSALARRAPVALMLDDLHWADDDTIALLRHVARSVGQQRLLLVSAYRSGEVEESGALAEALAVLRRQTTFERIGLKGLGLDDVAALLRVLAEERCRGSVAAEVDPALAQAILAETNGNPFFVRSVVLHLIEEGKLRIEAGSWRATAPIEEIGLPEGVRQLLNKRLDRLTPEARLFLTAGAAIGATFRFDVATAVAELNEERGFEAVDEALAAQLIAGAASPDTYAFVHALVRQTLYEALNPSRQVRYHRRIAEAMERIHGERAGEHAVEIAEHFHQSRTLAGAERGVPYALRAADDAEFVHAYDQAARWLRSALDLMPNDDPRRPRMFARLSHMLSWALHFADAVATASSAGELIAQSEGSDAAADYLASAVWALNSAGDLPGSWILASRGLGFIGDRRDTVWTILKWAVICQQASTDPGYPGIDVETEETCRVLDVADRLPPAERPPGIPFRSGHSARTLGRDKWVALITWGGEYRRVIELCRADVERAESQGQIATAAMLHAHIAVSQIALGSFAAANLSAARARELIARLPGRPHAAFVLRAVADDFRLALDEGWEAALTEGQDATEIPPEYRWVLGGIQAAAARVFARLGYTDPALQFLAGAVVAIEQGAGWANGYPCMICDATTALWILERTEHLDVIERNLREKVIAPDFHFPMRDARHSVARLCVLSKRYDEAAEWFAKARTVLDEQGARPLRAIVDYDEAFMYTRRGAVGDRERAAPLLETALAQFRAIRMPGWIRRAEQLLAEGPEREGSSTALHVEESAKPLPTRGVFRAQGDFWTIAHDGVTIRLKHERGLRFLAQLLRDPGREIPATEVVAGAASNGAAPPSSPVGSRTSLGDAGELLDAEARSAYKQRVAELREELDEAEGFNDTGRAERLREELDFLTRELSRAVGLGGRERKAGSHTERARVNVTRAISAVLKKIAVQHPALGEHLARTVRTGTFCSYAPDPRAPIEWEV